MKKRTNIKLLCAVLLTIVVTLCSQRATAQHTLTLTGGTGASYARFYPTEETKWMWGCETFGVAWRYYSEKPRFVGAVGIDLEYLERGFNMGWTYSSRWEGEGEDMKEIRTYRFYNRKVNTLMLPLVWQPHFYLAKNRVRIFIEAALVLSYNLSSSYSYENDERPGGKYEWKVPRDNRFGYGLSGGAGFALLFGQVEVGFKAKYNFGYSDILKNRNKYYSNSTDGYENPFYYSPLRSPIDNLNFMLTVGWRFNKRGFNEWFAVRPKKEKALKTFNFSEQTGANNSNQGNLGGMRR
jgi:hypothetical protein